MDVETLKAVLNRSRIAEMELARMLETIQIIRSRAEGTQARRFTVFSGGHGRAEYSPADKLVAMQYAIHEKVVQQLDWLAYNLYLIYQLEPSNERCVLVMR